MRTAIACLLAATTTLPALDLLDVCDLRLSGGPVGGDAEIEGPGGAASAIGMSGWRAGADLAVGVDLLFLGVLAGGGVAVDRRSGDGWERRATVGRLFAGPYLGVGPVNLELTGSIARGSASLEDPQGEGDDGSVDEYGADLALTVALPMLPVVVGATGGWLRTRSDHQLPGGDAAYSSDGWRAAAILGWRF